MTDALVGHIRTMLDAVREPLALDRWSIQPEIAQLEDARACCAASPEYREARISFDLDKLQTGDEVDEIAVHELTHCHTWPLHALAENLAQALAESAPESLREPLAKLLLEEVRKAGEQVTTDVGHAYVRLLRRAGILASPTASS